MTTPRKFQQAAVFTAITLATTGFAVSCGTEQANTPSPASTTTAATPAGPDPRQAFDACKALTPEFLKSTGLDVKMPLEPDEANNGKVYWKGCGGIAKVGPTFADQFPYDVHVTNGKIDELPPVFVNRAPLTVNGRRVVRYQHPNQVPRDTGCTSNTEMKGGSLLIAVYPLPPVPGHKACELLDGLVQKIVPLLPPTA